MTALAKKLIGKNILNIFVISSVFVFYILAAGLGLPMIVQLGVIASALLIFLKVR